MGPVIPKHVVSSQTREQIRLPWIPRGILNQRTAKEASTCSFCSSASPYPAGDLNLIILNGLSPLLFQPRELTSSCSGLAHGTRTKPIHISTILATEIGSKKQTGAGRVNLGNMGLNCAPQKRYFEVLNLRASECDFIWKWSLQR